MSRPEIHLAKLRAQVRGLPHRMIFTMLDDVLGLLPPAKLQQLVNCHLRSHDLSQAEPASRRDSPQRLRATVEEFAAASRRGDYYETFDVNSKNCTEQSNGAIAWIEECNRLLDRCVALSSRRCGVDDVEASFELLFDLIDDVDTFEMDIIFFADEGGAYEIGIKWGTMMEAWFGRFAQQAGHDGANARRVADIVARGDARLAREVHRRMAQTVHNRLFPGAAEANVYR